MLSSASVHLMLSSYSAAPILGHEHWFTKHVM